jgi:hypothetical protein
MAEALELLSSNRFIVHNQFSSIGNQEVESQRNLISATLEQLVSLEYISEEQRQIATMESEVSVESVVVTAVSTGIAIWVMYLGQLVVTVLSTSAAWVQIDPLVVMQGDNSVDKDTDLSAEERLFENAASKSK